MTLKLSTNTSVQDLQFSMAKANEVYSTFDLREMSKTRMGHLDLFVRSKCDVRLIHRGSLFQNYERDRSINLNVNCK